MGVAFVDGDTIRKLNKKFRNKNKPTNVLSFAGSGQPVTPYSKKKHIGEIVLCATYAQMEAKSAAMDAEVRLAHLLIHGTLHLLGYDHERSNRAQTVMETRESKLLGMLKRETLAALKPLLRQ